MPDEDGGTVPREEMIAWLRVMGCKKSNDSGSVGYWMTPGGMPFSVMYYSWQFYKDQITTIIASESTDPDTVD